MKKTVLSAIVTFVCVAVSLPLMAQLSWTADNGNGTFTNPLFYDEFSDPDILRVGDDFYLAGTTMHSVPGLVILHSRDLVNWENVSSRKWAANSTHKAVLTALFVPRGSVTERRKKPPRHANTPANRNSQ